ncbi:hypothetical protein OG225_14885 [Nocardia sp. NBC_01377]|uniref:hypothetical protein n=1 Tax=Nocardia sp. NBC_01377 TaxID=2903595 RepID=UPI00324A9EFE
MARAARTGSGPLMVAHRVLTLAEIDAELAFRSEEFAKITSTLLELDKHRGLTLVRRFPPTGLTERRWAPVREALDLMWQDYGRMRVILESARETRGTRSRLDENVRAELTRMLRGRPHEISRTPIPMAQRSLTGPSESVLFVGLADTLDRMRHTFPRIAEFLDAVDTVNTRVMSGLAPIQDRLDRGGVVPGELPLIESGVADLLRRSATDPLALTADEITARVGALDAELRRESARLSERAAMVANWPAAVATTRTQWETLRDTTARAARARAEVVARIRTGALPPASDSAAPLGAELEMLAVRSGTAADLLALRARIAEAAVRAASDVELYQGLLDRREELRGRLAAYRAKATRLGVGDDGDLLDAYGSADRLLSQRPCDLAAATRAIADYQQSIGEKSGRKS